MTGINNFDVDTLWDLSIATPKLTLTNKTTGTGLSGFTYWFEAYGGGGTAFHTGTVTAPDKTGIWTSYTLPEAIPMVQGHVEWSGMEFYVRCWIKNTTTSETMYIDKKIRICRPAGNKTGQGNNFGGSKLLLEVKCERARIWVQDTSNYGYNGQLGTVLSKTIKLFYPADGTGTPPDPITVSNTNTALFAIGANADGYQVAMDTVYDYEFQGGNHVRIRYKFQQSFAVACNVDLCPLLCEIKALEDDYERNGCSVEDRQKMMLIQSKIARVLIAKQQPLCGENVQAIVDEIKKLGNFACNCSGSDANGAGIPDPGGVQPETDPDCAAVLECVNAELNEAEFACLAKDKATWEAMPIRTKLSLLIKFVCDASSTGCNPLNTPTITQNSTTLTISALVGFSRYKWELYKQTSSGGNIYKDFVKAGIYMGNAGTFPITITGLASGAYNVELVGECSENKFSPRVTIDLTIP